MKFTDRAARMDRHHKRHKRRVGLNLVSLMDIFTILVFFLLVNSSDVEVLPSARDVELPESNAETKARETVVVLVTPAQLLVQGQVVADIADVIARDAIIIPELKAALEAQTDRVLRQDAREDIASREVTIMGDKDISYGLLRRIMATSTAANYGRLSFAVMQATSELQMSTIARAND